MDKNTKTTPITKNAEKALGLAQEFADDIKAATEAMKRTERYKNTQIIFSDQYVYEQIFSKDS